MLKYLIAGVLLLGLASPAFAAKRAKFYLVIDTVGNCSVLEGKPSEGLKRIGEKKGYPSKEAAVKALKEGKKAVKRCKGIVE